MFLEQSEETIEPNTVLCHKGEQQAEGDGRLIALSIGTKAVISATRPDSISDVTVSPLIFSLMFSPPFLPSPLCWSSHHFSFPLLPSSLPSSLLC